MIARQIRNMSLRQNHLQLRLRRSKQPFAKDHRAGRRAEYRDDCVNDSEYSHFIDEYLSQNLGLTLNRLQGDFGGQTWLVKDQDQNMAILVQHETGLEILSAIGSIASLVTLIPLISSGWTKLRHGFRRSRFDMPDGGGVEIRQINQSNVLIEQRAPSVEVYVLNVALRDQAGLRQKVERLEGEISELRRGQSLTVKKPKAKTRPKAQGKETQMMANKAAKNDD